jgi:hypothetical protein
MNGVAKLAFCVVLFLALSACGGARLNVFEEKEAVKPFYPPLPGPIVPVNPDPIIATPDLTKEWNAEVDAGERRAYVIYGFDGNTWLSMKQYEDRKDYYILQLREILKYLGHPALQDAIPEE